MHPELRGAPAAPRGSGIGVGGNSGWEMAEDVNLTFSNSHPILKSALENNKGHKITDRAALIIQKIISMTKIEKKV